MLQSLRNKVARAILPEARSDVSLSAIVNDRAQIEPQREARIGNAGRPRTAVLISGFLRSATLTQEAFKALNVNGEACDIFVSTWDLVDVLRPDPSNGEEVKVDTEITSSHLKKLYGKQLMDFVIRPYELCEASMPAFEAGNGAFDVFSVDAEAKQHGAVWVKRLRSQWYLVEQGLNLIADYERRAGFSYDVICRCRSDIVPMDTSLPFEPDVLMTSGTYPWGEVVPPGRISDMMYWGERRVMMQLKQLYLSIEDIYQKHRINVSNAEALLSAFTLMAGIAHVPAAFPLKRISA